MSNAQALVTVLDQQHDEADEDDRQFGLFGPPLTAGGEAKLSVVAKRGPGRPPGSRNKRTERTISFLLARHRDPREVLLEIAESNVLDLVALVGCTPFEALQEKRLAAAAVLPYVAQRQPLAISLDHKSTVYLTISDGQVEARERADDDGFGITAQVVEFQEVSDDEA